MTLAHKRAQFTSMDMMISVVVVLLFLGTMMIFASNIFNKKESKIIYGSTIFSNIENLDDSVAFISNYRVNETKLNAFADGGDGNMVLNEDGEVESKIFAGSTSYSADDSDACMFFFDNNNNIVAIGNATVGLFNTLGWTYTSEDHSLTGLRAPCDPNDPCKFYSKTYLYIKPVLRQGKIMNLYIVVCQ